MKIFGTCRKDDRKSVAAVNQTACCIIQSLPAGSCHTVIKENAPFASGETIRVRALPMGEIPQIIDRSRPDRAPAFSHSTASLSLRSKDSVPWLKAAQSTHQIHHEEIN
jgi:hypothetical protein